MTRTSAGAFTTSCSQRSGLLKREEILPDSVQVHVELIKDAFHICGSFQAADTEASYSLHIIIDPVNLEVTVID